MNGSRDLSETNRILLIVLCIHLLWEATHNVRIATKAGFYGKLVDDNSRAIATDSFILESLWPSFDKEAAMDRIIPQQHSPGRIALVMRAVDPIQPCLLKRVVHICKTMETQEEFQKYDFHLLVDQTQENVTNRNRLQNYFYKQNESNLELPSIFGVTEDLLREEFPELSEGYMRKPLVDGTYSYHPRRTFMWQLMTPAIVMFSHYHQEYDYTWVFEDDVWSIGKPLIELFREWDGQMKNRETDLAVFRNRRSGVPYNKKMQNKHTVGFNRILRNMKGAPDQRKQWTTLLARDNQTWSSVWTEWNATHIPRWRCVSDTFYRHSRAFSNYLHKYLSKDVYQFAECFQQPLAWKGNLTITDLEYLEVGERIQWEQGIVNKITRKEAIRRYKHWRKEKNITILLYHGQSFHRMHYTGSEVSPDLICREDRFGLS